MRWPNASQVLKALEDMPRHPVIAGLAQLDALRMTERSLLVDVIAYDVTTSAHDIPDPRLTHRGPWTSGWTPL